MLIRKIADLSDATCIMRLFSVALCYLLNIATELLGWEC